MMFTKDDFKISDPADLLAFAPIAVMLALIAPLLIIGYSLGFVMDITGWLKTR